MSVLAEAFLSKEMAIDLACHYQKHIVLRGSDTSQWSGCNASSTKTLACSKLLSERFMAIKCEYLVYY